MKYNILIAGGAGFIGSNLALRLLNKGHRVVVVDNLITGSQRNIEELEQDKNFQFFKLDIVQPLPGELTKIQFHRIYNLACPASPIDFSKYSFEILWVNSIGMRNLLELSLKQQARFLQTSTSEVYGEPLEHPQRESYRGNVSCLGPRSCYDEGKRFAESLIMNYKLKEDADIRIVRIFNTYGPRMRTNDGRVIPNFITQALENRDITVYGDGTQTRSFCYVDDLVEGIVRTMESSYDNGPVNLGNPDEHTIIELAHKIIKFTASCSRVVHLDLPKDDPSRRKPDISLARQKLNWSPKISLEEGLRETIKYFQSLSSSSGRLQ